MFICYYTGFQTIIFARFHTLSSKLTVGVYFYKTILWKMNYITSIFLEQFFFTKWIF